MPFVLATAYDVGAPIDELTMSARKRRSKKKPPLPRAPLPRQTERRHEDKTKRPVRRQKHRKPPADEE